MYFPDTLREYSEAVMDFLRELPPTTRDPGLSLELTLHPQIKRQTTQEISEFFLESNGEQHTAGPVFHWMSASYPTQARVITTSDAAYRRAVSRPWDLSQRTPLGKEVPRLPFFMFNGEPYAIYNSEYNPLAGLARLGYIVEGFELGVPEDKREGKNFFLGSVRVVQPVLGSTIDVRERTYALFYNEAGLSLLWNPEDIPMVKEQMERLEERLRSPKV